MTTDALARIDHALALQDALPNLDGAGWLPGDPLYDRYTQSAEFQRDMFDLLPVVPGRPPRCSTCDVSWRGPDPCWVCGEHPPEPDSRPTFTALVDRMLHRMSVPTRDAGPFAASIDVSRRIVVGYDGGRDGAEGMTFWDEIGRTVERVADEQWRRVWLNTVLADVPSRRTRLRSLCVDGHEYRRRTRSRRRRR